MHAIMMLELVYLGLSNAYLTSFMKVKTLAGSMVPHTQLSSFFCL